MYRQNTGTDMHLIGLNLQYLDLTYEVHLAVVPQLMANMNSLIKLGLILAILCTSGAYSYETSEHDLNAMIAEIEATITIDELGEMFFEMFENVEFNIHDRQACERCNTTITYSRLLIQSPDLIKSLAPIMCKKVVGQTIRVCEGLLERMSEPLAYLFQHTKLTTPEICGTFLSPDCITLFGLPFTHNIKWELPLPKRKPFTPKAVNDKQLKMLHLTDIHLDLWYTPGSNSSCGEFVCCRSTSPGDNHTAGYWSQTKDNCDCPQYFVDNSIKQIGDNHKDIDLVIWTGDNIPHDVWNTTRDVNLQHIRAMTDTFKKTFGDLPVFPCLGNHESHPINLYVPEELSIKTQGKLSMKWLYDTLADDYWKQWIDTEEAKKTFKKGGYYSKRFSDTLKVVVMNTNMAQNENYYIAYDPIDPDGQLQWLIDELNSAETDGSYVMLLGHIPPSDLYASWSHNYFRIMERYQHLIVSSYFGHTHNDEIVVLYNKDFETNGTYAISHGYIGASLTTYTLLNPGYRIFTIDSNGRPLDFDVFYTNVTDDNIKGQQKPPKWSSDTSGKQMYGMDSLSTESWDLFMSRAKTDDKLVRSYVNHYHRFSDDFIQDMTTKGRYNMTDMRDILLTRQILNPFHKLLPNNYK
ncbi:unnamed protein product [Medioppia subpectinata]|uniref:Calcineurin-like phosphoesterase domain-containing protein n=1 Tax=Medioppia subpectinata TaxID=1979941 RepID=A0A7R9KZS1_9ACAR|nr:unnamed protein product [Medioppia subpectinata]CAG2112619.1 unnamed protein product [Medioppia subpectinata]